MALQGEAEDNARVTETLKRNYKKGLFPGGAQYKNALAQSQKIAKDNNLDWTPEDRALFDEVWDNENRNRGNTDLAESFAKPGPLLSGMR